LLKLFDRHFQETLNQLLLEKIGFSKKQTEYLMESHPETIDRFKKYFSYFEKAQSKRKAYRVPDGITRDAVFCIREILREFPKLWLENPNPIGAEQFIEIIRSGYASRRDAALSFNRIKNAELFQKTYLELVKSAADKFYSGNLKRLMLEICMRSSLINRSDRITGDATIKVTRTLIRHIWRISATHLYQIIAVVAENQKFVPVNGGSDSPPAPRGKAKKLVEVHFELIQSHREGL
jgi:hypothetical protein